MKYFFPILSQIDRYVIQHAHNTYKHTKLNNISCQKQTFRAMFYGSIFTPQKVVKGPLTNKIRSFIAYGPWKSFHLFAIDI